MLRRTTIVTAVIIMPVLFAAWVILFLFPTRTEQLWAWTIGTRMTPITMGSGYLGGVWYFFRVARDPRPHHAAGGLFAAAVFVWGLFGATVLHWEKFHHDHAAFWAWTALYFVTPVFLPFLFVANRRASASSTADHLPRWAVVILASIGITQELAAVVWFIRPSLAIGNWPWPMTPLTTRTLASFVAFSGSLMLWVLVDRRASAMRYGIEALTVGLLTTSVGAIAARGDFTGSTGTVLYVLALPYLVAVYALILVTQRSPGPAPTPATGAAAGLPT